MAGIGDHRMKILEVGLIGNGIELIRVCADNLDEFCKSELRAAFLHAIIMYNDSYSALEISYFSMKKTVVMVRRFKIKNEDLIIYTLLKPDRIGLKDLFADKKSSLHKDFEPKFSNLYNVYLQKIGERITANVDQYKTLENDINMLFFMKKRKNWIFN